MSTISQSGAAASTTTAPEFVDDTPEQMLDRATEAFLRGRSYEALDGFNRLLALQPSNAAAYYNRAYVRLERREYYLALEDFTEAMKYRPGFAAASMNRGVVLSNLGRLEEALVDLNNAAEWAPSDPDVFFNRAIVQVKRGAMEDAMRDYDKTMRLDGSDTNQAGTRTRLKSLLGAVDENVEQGDRNSRIIEEIYHARTAELALAFTERTCMSLGANRQALSAIAQVDGWKTVPQEDLMQSGNSTMRNTAGWTLINRLGRILVIQARSIQNPDVVSCSIRAKLGDSHWFEDFATLFASKFDMRRLVISELGDRWLARQTIVRDDDARIDITLQQTRDRNVLLIGTVHGRNSSPPKP